MLKRVAQHVVPSAPASAEDFPSALVKFALPSGSLQDATVDLFARASFDIRFTSRDYFPEVDDPDLGLISFRAQEVSRYVEAGVADAGITGRDWIVENVNHGAFDVRPSDKVVQVAELKYSKATSRPARWVLAVPEDSPINSAEDCEGLTIATELPETTKQYFAERGINCNVEYSWGTTEVKAKGLLVDGIVDITETGSSLRANNLRIVLTIMESTTRLIANKAAWAVPEKREKIKAIAMLLQAAIDGKDKVGLKANIPKQHYDTCLNLLPSETAPTVANLANSEYISVEVVCTAVQARDLSPKLHQLGARGILTYPLETIIS